MFCNAPNYNFLTYLCWYVTLKSTKMSQHSTYFDVYICFCLLELWLATPILCKYWTNCWTNYDINCEILKLWHELVTFCEKNVFVMDCFCVVTLWISKKSYPWTLAMVCKWKQLVKNVLVNNGKNLSKALAFNFEIGRANVDFGFHKF